MSRPLLDPIDVLNAQLHELLTGDHVHLWARQIEAREYLPGEARPLGPGLRFEQLWRCVRCDHVSAYRDTEAPDYARDWSAAGALLAEMTRRRWSWKIESENGVVAMWCEECPGAAFSTDPGHSITETIAYVARRALEMLGGAR